MRVTFAGWKPQEELSEGVRASQAFVFPSLREFGGGAVLEAMASGLPAIIVDYGGPAELVTPKTGTAVPMQPAEPLVRNLRTAMEELVTDHELCARQAAAAIAEVKRKYTWAAKARQIVDIYRQTCGAAPEGEPADTPAGIPALV